MLRLQSVIIFWLGVRAQKKIVLISLFVGDSYGESISGKVQLGLTCQAGIERKITISAATYAARQRVLTVQKKLHPQGLEYWSIGVLE
jgi:hypothetical protein